MPTNGFSVQPLKVPPIVPTFQGKGPASRESHIRSSRSPRFWRTRRADAVTVAWTVRPFRWQFVAYGCPGCIASKPTEVNSQGLTLSPLATIIGHLITTAHMDPHGTLEFQATLSPLQVEVSEGLTLDRGDLGWTQRVDGCKFRSHRLEAMKPLFVGT